MDAPTARALELHRPAVGPRRGRGCLLHAIDRCKTPGGSRMLDARLAAPLAAAAPVRARLDAVERFSTDQALRTAVR